MRRAAEDLNVGHFSAEVFADRKIGGKLCGELISQQKTGSEIQ